MPSLTPAELATAQAAAERRYAQIAATAVPKNFELKYAPRLHGARVDGKTLRVPRPVTRKSLYVFLMTCAVATGLNDPAAAARRRFQDEGPGPAAGRDSHQVGQAGAYPGPARHE
jgi:hypothetical protein